MRTGGAPAAATTIAVRAGGGPRDYTVQVGAGLLDEVGARAAEAAPGARRWVVISDDTVAALHGDRVRRSFGTPPPPLLTFAAGEASKTRAEWARLTDAMLALGLGRDSGVIALGGGVVGDLAGFVAATYLRGVPVVQLPTSIVAMVDSAVGGKTGVDTPAGKNLVGAFHPPATVLVDPTVVATLPRLQRAEGLAEAVKHGAIVDAAYARRIADDADMLLAGDVTAIEGVVRRSIEIKASVVGLDEREGGLREVLNFGHTLGHALEAASEFRLPHGEAVAIGMVLEARLGERTGQTRPGTAAELARILDAVALPTAPPPGLDPEVVAGYLDTDKKVRAGAWRVVLLEELGAIARPPRGWAHPVDPAAVREVLDSA